MRPEIERVLSGAERWAVVHGEALATLQAMPDACVDAVVTDPPYPEIDRDYGRMTEADWFALMQPLVREVRRVLKPRGSAVFVLQPNSEHVGRMRGWLWRFMAWCCDEWNMVQDAWWWNPTAPPTVHTHRTRGLMRPSVKACVWPGASDCWRDTAVDERGGCTPFNLIPISNSDSSGSGGAKGHGAATPLALAAWWTRYLCPEGGVVLDPFGGSGTMGEAALSLGRRVILVERHEPYVPIARATCAAASKQCVLGFAGALPTARLCDDGQLPLVTA